MYAPNTQTKLLMLLREKGFDITQTTLARDIKLLNISKMPDDSGHCKYMSTNKEILPQNPSLFRKKVMSTLSKGFISIEFSYNLGVIKTTPGVANEISRCIKSKAPNMFIGVITTNDTILLVPKEGINKQDITDMLAICIPEYKKDKEF